VAENSLTGVNSAGGSSTRSPGCIRSEVSPQAEPRSRQIRIRLRWPLTTGSVDYILIFIKLSNHHQERVFAALADANRRKILALLKHGSLSAGEIANHFAITKGSLSHHFNVLKSADLIRCERRGQRIVYSINTTVFDDLASVLFELFATARSSRKARAEVKP
jgi:DNA-binding transcriptional ArsR family regulator